MTMRRAYTAKDPIEAHLIKSMLSSHGIHARVEGEALWAGRGELPLTPDTCPSIWVDEEDMHRVRELLAPRRPGQLGPLHDPDDLA